MQTIKLKLKIQEESDSNTQPANMKENQHHKTQQYKQNTFY